MMPRPSGGGKGPVFSLTPGMIDMTKSPREPSSISVAPPSSTRTAHNTPALCSLSIPLIQRSRIAVSVLQMKQRVHEPLGAVRDGRVDIHFPDWDVQARRMAEEEGMTLTWEVEPQGQ